MKYQINPTAAQSMTDLQFLAAVDEMEDLLDIHAENLSKSETLDNLISLQSFLAEASDAEIMTMIASEEELAETFNGNVADFRKSIDTAVENFFRDASSGIGNIIGAFIQRSHTTLKYLEPMVKECKTKIEQLDDKKFAGMKNIFRVPVTSKYLPKTDDYFKAVSAIAKLAAYVKSTAPESFSIEKAHEFLQGTIFLKNNKEKANSSKGNWMYWVPIVSWFKFVSEGKECWKKGWDTKEKFQQGLAGAESLLDSIKACQAGAEKAKSVKADATDEVKDNVDAMLHCCKFIDTEAAHLARGMVVASKKIVAGTFKRMGLNAVDR